VLDPFGGRADLEAKKIRLLHPRSLVDDPTRAYRAVKYAARLGFIWDEEFEKALKAARGAQAFQALSGDRMRRGIEEIFLEGYWDRSLSLAAELELLGDVLSGWKCPLLPSKKKTAEFVASTSLEEPRVMNLRPKPEEIWRLLLEPLPRPERAAVASRLNFPKALRRAAGAEPR
jgi:tRNA nucleotidyltransferase (CCA-adding enzyme)